MLMLAVSGAARAAGTTRVGVGATVVSSMHLRLASASQPANVGGSALAVRKIPAPGGTYHVTAVQVGVQTYGTSATVMMQGNETRDGGALRYFAGTGGAWNRASFGARVPALAETAVRVAVPATSPTGALEVGVFVPEGAPETDAPCVVLTILTDGAAPARPSVSL